MTNKPTIWRDDPPSEAGDYRLRYRGNEAPENEFYATLETTGHWRCAMVIYRGEWLVQFGPRVLGAQETVDLLAKVEQLEWELSMVGSYGTSSGLPSPWKDTPPDKPGTYWIQCNGTEPFTDTLDEHGWTCSSWSASARFGPLIPTAEELVSMQSQIVANRRWRDSVMIDLGKQIEKAERLEAAARALYLSAYWSPDRECDSEILWKQLRDAAGIEPGHSPQRISRDNEVERLERENDHLRVQAAELAEIHRVWRLKGVSS